MPSSVHSKFASATSSLIAVLEVSYEDFGLVSDLTIEETLENSSLF